MIDSIKMTNPYGQNGRALPKMNVENLRQPKYGYARARTEFQRSAHAEAPRSQYTARAPKASGNASSKRMRFLSKSDKGWSWLSINMRDVASDIKMGMARKGELPPELVQALWGRKGLKSCCKGPEAVVDHFDKKLEAPATPREKDTQVRGSKTQKRMPETLMDVLLQRWVYFDHVHSDVSQVDKHIHAKYCENAFGHFLLPDGRQVHGSYSVPLSYLVQELRKLLTYLRSKIVHTQYKELPVFDTPKQLVLPEFEPPAMKALPQLYPIAGLLPIPTEESEGIGPDLPLPVFDSPIPKDVPSLELPPPLKAPPLKLPPQPMFLEDENSIDRSLYKEDPLPTYYPPEKLPLPDWQDPKLQDFPSEPVHVKAAVLPMPVLESMPPFVPPIPDPRPCEKSYYAVEDESATCLCEGKCMANLDKYQRKGKPCQAKSRPLLPLPPPPYPLPLVPKPQPEFFPPEGEPLPEFHPPKLKDKPVYIPPPPLVLPPWRPPPSPDPIGWIGGQRPIFLIDCSGTMAKGGMKMAHDILSTIFAPGGQVDIGATHFDIIMYSFDAWSYAAMSNYTMHRQGTSPRFWRPEEAMQEKTPANLEAALNWALRWGAGGSTNLLKALDVALNRTFCDCIYLLTDGKPDKPVLVLQQIKRILKMRGSITPIYTMGLATTKYGERFLQRISEATGGCLRHLDANWKKQSPKLSGTELEDMLWTKAIIEETQRRNLANGIIESIRDIEERVRMRYEKERHAPRIAAHQMKEKQMEMDYQALIKFIDAENASLMAEAKEKYEIECKAVVGRNKHEYDLAKARWMEEVRRVEQENQRAVEEVEKWRLQVMHIEEQNAQLVLEAKKQFEQDVKWIEEMNLLKYERALEEYETEVKKKKAAYEAAIRETERKQKELEATVATRNKANRDNYEKMMAEITAANTATVEKAHADHNARVAYIEAENARIKKEAEDAFSRELEKVRLENARRTAALHQKIQDIRNMKEAAISAYKAEVASTMAEHDIQAKKFAALNQESEERARTNWKLVSEAIKAENLANAQRSVEEFEKQSKYVHKENMRRVAQRAELLKRKLEVEKYNEEVVKTKKIKWKEDCAQAEKDYEEEVAKAKADHERLSEETNLKNEENFQAALLEHKAKVAAVESYNETIRPFVEASIQVKAEIARVDKFIKYIANACLGANRKSEDTNSDLNVLGKSEQGMETKILVEALQEAYSTKKEGGEYIQRPSFYAKRDFSGMIPIHPPRVSAHNCPDLDQHVRLKELEMLEIDQERLELEEAKSANDELTSLEGWRL